MLTAPRTDPGVRLSRTGLLPKVGRDRAEGLQCRPVLDPCEGSTLEHAGSGTVPGACRPTLASSGRAPSLHALRRRSSRPCSGASSVLRARPTPHPFPDGLPTRVPATARDRQRDCGPDEVSQVPTGFLSCVMGSSTTAERQRLAKRRRTCCLRLCQRPRPLRHCNFRGSIAHPTRLLCTLRGGRLLPPRNTHYRAPATAYSGRTCTGWTPPASPGALTVY